MKRIFLWRHMREVAAVAATLACAAGLRQAGWPWWAWVPAALIAGILGATVVVLSWFAYQKAVYEGVAARIREKIRRGEME
jgi:hypothetical protein